MLTERLARVYVRDVDLCDGQSDPRECVAQHNRCVREAAGVNDDGGAVFACSVDRVDQHTLVIALYSAHRDPKFGGDAGGQCLDTGESLGSVYLGFAGSEQIEIWAVYQQDLRGHGVKRILCVRVSGGGRAALLCAAVEAGLALWGD